jgi:ABC-type Fe3+-hydroxamate transport system substrate-binding protein
VIRQAALLVLLLVSLQAGAERRIVSLAPFLTDMLVQLGATEQLVGVLADAALPVELAELPRVGAYQDLSLEAVVAQRPDLVLAWTSGNPPALLARLEQMGVEVQRFDPQRLEDIAHTLDALGRLTGTSERAAALATDFRQKLDKLERPVHAHSPRVFLQVWDDPLYTLSDTQLVGDALRHCGARNVFGELRLLAPQIGRESVIAADPDIILLLADEQGQAEPWLQRWRRFPQMQAVRTDHLYLLDSSYLARATPEIVTGVARLCALVAERPADTLNP